MKITENSDVYFILLAIGMEVMALLIEISIMQVIVGQQRKVVMRHLFV